MDLDGNKITELDQERPRRARGIYLLPNLLTTAALFAGFYAVLAAMNGQFEKAAVATFVAMILDGLDGRVARITNTQSAFGAEYDSLSDMVAFGLAPALVTYEWALSELGRIVGINALYARSAKYGKFEGLPIPRVNGLKSRHFALWRT